MVCCCLPAVFIEETQQRHNSCLEMRQLHRGQTEYSRVPSTSAFTTKVDSNATNYLDADIAGPSHEGFSMHSNSAAGGCSSNGMPSRGWYVDQTLPASTTYDGASKTVESIMQPLQSPSSNPVHGPPYHQHNHQHQQHWIVPHTNQLPSNLQKHHWPRAGPQHQSHHVAAEPCRMAAYAADEHQPLVGPRSAANAGQLPSNSLHAPYNTQSRLHAPAPLPPVQPAVLMCGQAQRSFHAVHNHYNQVSMAPSTLMKAHHQLQQQQPAELQQSQQHQPLQHRRFTASHQQRSMGISDVGESDRKAVKNPTETTPRKSKSHRVVGAKIGKSKRSCHRVQKSPTCTLEGDDDGFGNGNNW